MTRSKNKSSMKIHSPESFSVIPCNEMNSCTCFRASNSILPLRPEPITSFHINNLVWRISFQARWVSFSIFNIRWNSATYRPSRHVGVLWSEEQDWKGGGLEVSYRLRARVWSASKKWNGRMWNIFYSVIVGFMSIPESCVEYSTDFSKTSVEFIVYSYFSPSAVTFSLTSIKWNYFDIWWSFRMKNIPIISKALLGFNW